jgi:hypothetical protein
MMDADFYVHDAWIHQYVRHFYMRRHVNCDVVMPPVKRSSEGRGASACGRGDADAATAVWIAYRAQLLRERAALNAGSGPRLVTAETFEWEEAFLLRHREHCAALVGSAAGPLPRVRSVSPEHKPPVPPSTSVTPAAPPNVGSGRFPPAQSSVRRPQAQQQKQERPAKRTRLAKSMPASMDTALEKYWQQRYRLFSRFDQGIQLDHESWYSVTPEAIAAHTAEKCAAGCGGASAMIVDPFCGVGGNTIQFAQQFGFVLAADSNPERVRMAAENARVYGVDGE